MVVTVRLLTKLTLASASPRNPNVWTVSRSSKLESLLVVWRSHRIGRSSARMPWPSSWIWRSLFPPSFTVTVMDVAPASRAFSSSSFSAEAGRWITSPAATRFTTSSASRRMGLGGAIARRGAGPDAGRAAGAGEI